MSDSDSIRFFEDVEISEFRYHGPGRVVDAEEIKRFAAEFDPMPFHLDEEAAKESILGRLCASSVHVLAIGSQLSHEGMGTEADEMAVLSGLGWDKVRLVSPLFAGDHVRVRSRVATKRASGSRPDCGIVTMDNQVVRADESLIASYEISVLVLKRPAAEA